MMNFDLTLKISDVSGQAVVEEDGVYYYWDGANKTPVDEETLQEATVIYDAAVAEYDAAEYQRTRVAAYPSIQDQLDMQYWDSVNGTTTWADAIAAVKAQYPKPE